MYRASTPTFTFTLPFDIDTIADCVITFDQDDENILEKTMDDIIIDETAKTLSVQLTQTETLLFETGKANVQVNILTAEDKRIASTIQKFKVYENLHEDIMGEETDE